MKTRILSIVAIVLLSGSYSLYAQGFQSPAEGKSLVYFVRVSGYGGGASFEYFHQDKYIGVFKGKNYMMYECDPGQHLFWASSENKEFITADLKEGGTYVVIVDPVTGFWKAHVGLTPIYADNVELFNRAKDLVYSKKPIVTPEAKIEKMNKKLEDFIPEMLQRYQDEWKDLRNFKHILSDMAIPDDAMK